jgi:hypothetical protein
VDLWRARVRISDVAACLSTSGNKLEFVRQTWELWWVQFDESACEGSTPKPLVLSSQDILLCRLGVSHPIADLVYKATGEVTILTLLERYFQWCYECHSYKNESSVRVQTQSETCYKI